MAPEYYVFTGRDGEVIPRRITHVLIDKALKFVPAEAFYEHPNIEELICHDGVEKIEEFAFRNCPSLRRVIIPSVKVLEKSAFHVCRALTRIECSKLEIIGEYAFGGCKSLRSIDLPSIKIVEIYAFGGCTNLENAKFGKELESIGRGVFYYCTSLERISLPLKDGMIAEDSVFRECIRLNQVDLVGGVHETIAAMLVEEWKNEMNEEIDEISQILPNTPAGNFADFGRKTQAIRAWISSVLRKYTLNKAEHRRYVNVAAATLKPALPNDILFKNVLPFLELPSDTFDGEE